ncbi:MAG: tetratricopeptide repeat protein [Okeania sp. SIO1H6]|uniref:Tetratricopeptide repeat protein n=1 Tax=Okeania hirsuta TaxID=1458930 RepID=A0A3N6QAZ7_9CYAN|nr:tetratricopeptide repeat protein [Okeania sp. SIO1H4]NES90226.1 tetratricopeptide repeat protein [Okeania sp. SIO2B9]NET12622.1 tetratricopeptide repeat protein [Okeania sp. SIO1H6]NET19134.1 tetratricopeptide repeat protein [Okeania sp. SIO1H5]NET75006.1 tetratricopeptide repeat protein [Okeania sp. SIO1F9]NET92526.1 tetratricopeptide repeat protein [Okeania sp. SIO1H2]RQH11586.1 tetratricopeptide repeat protein [Okeania hirsuta]
MALEKYQQALELWRQQEISFGQMVSLSGMVRTYESLKKYSQALDRGKEALSLSSELKNDLLKANTFILIGRVYQAENNYQEALSHLKQ